MGKPTESELIKFFVEDMLDPTSVYEGEVPGWLYDLAERMVGKGWSRK